MIAYAMLYTAAVGVPVLLTALCLSWVLRRYGRSERLVWLGALVLSFALPVFMLLSPSANGGAAAGAATPGTGVIGLPEVIVVPRGGLGFGLGEMLVAAWLLASALLALRWLLASLRLAKSSESWRASMLDGVTVWMTEDLGPAVCGVFRPRVLVPAWLRSLPRSKRELVLQHEQEHIRARDPVLISFARLTRVLVPWNPLVWILASRLVRAVELDCDRRVLRKSPDVAAYGSTLLSVSSRRPGRLVAAAAFAESHAPLRNRILAMTTPSRTVSVLALVSATILGAILLVGALQIPVPALSIEVQVTPRGPQGDAVAPRPGAPPDAQGKATEDPLASTWRTIIRERQTETGTRAKPPIQAAPRSGATLLPPRVDGDVSAAPTFTPYTVAPQILNRDEVVRAMTAVYPARLRAAGIGGTVRVYFYVDADGLVQNTRINRGSGLDALDQAALAVAGVYRFSPAMNRDEPVPVWVSFPITFQMR